MKNNKYKPYKKSNLIFNLKKYENIRNFVHNYRFCFYVIINLGLI